MLNKIIERLDSSVFAKNIAAFIPGILFLLYLLDLFYKVGLKLPLSKELSKLLLNNDTLLAVIFVVTSLAVGSYIYLYGLRIYSGFFSWVFPNGMDDRDSAHIFWRHFSISFSFAVLLMLILELLSTLIQPFSLLLVLFLAFLVTFFNTYLLHNDIKINKKNNFNEKWKTFQWDEEDVNKKYYSYNGLLIIANDQKNKIKKLETSKSSSSPGC